MSSNIAIDDAELKSRLARFGILTPITNTTKKVLLKKLHYLEMNSVKNETNPGSSQCSSNANELMDTTQNDLNEYEIRDEISKLGYKQIPLTDSTRPVLSNMVRKKKNNFKNTLPT